MKIKLLIKNTVLSFFVLSMAVSCKKQLDLNPYDSIALSQGFSTVLDGTSWDNGFYSSLRNNTYGIFTITQDVQADQLDASLDYGNRNGAPYQWITFLSDDYSISGVWSSYYNALANINECIANFKNITLNTAADTAKLNQYYGDAYLLRAYYYLELVLRWAKPYEPATASTDLGVPLVLTYDIEDKPARATVKETYDQILSDIAQAKTYLAGVAGAQSATKFNIDVVNALEARVRLYMQDWTGAMTAANAVISTGTYPLIDTVTDLTNMWTNDVSSEVIFQVFLQAPNELGNVNVNNVNNIYLGYISANGKYDPDFIPTQDLLNFYDNADIRKSAYFATKPCTISGLSSNLVLVNKYPGNPALFTTANTNYENAPKIFRIAEQYLIYAEAAANAGDNDKALNALNTLREARGLAALTSSFSGGSLMQAIHDERTRELAFEGFRLWDLKRWHQGFTRGTPQNMDVITQGSNYNLLTVAPDANKFVWGIPTNDMTINKNLVQNPGW